MDELPVELIFHIATFLEPDDLVRLQFVSRRLSSLARDKKLWKRLCFENSRFQALRRRRELTSAANAISLPSFLLQEDPRVVALQRAAATAFARPRSGSGSGSGLGSESDSEGATAHTPASHSNGQDHLPHRVSANETLRAMANWDPSYPTEEVDWYQEYRQRHAPISTDWLQQPTNGAQGSQALALDILGVGLYHDNSDVAHCSRVVAPLDDGSVCLWDLHEGNIRAQSGPGLLSVNGPFSGLGNDDSKAEMTNTGVVECVSVDSAQRRAYFAVQSGLSEVDLETLQVISHERFPFSISALSESRHPVPLTVGTTLSLHLHDPRVSQFSRLSPTSFGEQCDISTSLRNDWRRPPPYYHGDDSLQSLLKGSSLPKYAPLFQPGPLSILHLPTFGGSANDASNGAIYVAGRFSSILNYDRRTFPKLRGHLHSGASLCSLTSLPYPSTSLDMDLMRLNELSIEDVDKTKSRQGQTLVACGEYKTKGSLELYELAPIPHTSNQADWNGNVSTGTGTGTGNSASTTTAAAGGLQTSTYKNRFSASSSKLLSVATHGTRLVFADGNGMLKWIERDGSTEVRTWNINSATTFISSRNPSYASPSSPHQARLQSILEQYDQELYHHQPSNPYDARTSAGLSQRYSPAAATAPNATVVRKILPVPTSQGRGPGELLVWTGERIGLLGFGGGPAAPTHGLLHSSRQKFKGPSSDRADSGMTEDELHHLQEQARAYRDEMLHDEAMRRALERQANEVQFLRGLGLGGFVN